MNIIEAIKSGKKFRRKGWSYFVDIEEFESFFYRSDDILADDWEVEEYEVDEE